MLNEGRNKMAPSPLITLEYTAAADFGNGLLENAEGMRRRKMLHHPQPRWFDGGSAHVGVSSISSLPFSISLSGLSFAEFVMLSRLLLLVLFI